MNLYSQLSKISFLKNRYVAKFLFVAFFGILAPLIGLLFFVIYMKSYFAPLDLFLIATSVTILGALVITTIIKGLLLPVLKATTSLLNYQTSLTLPHLPVDYTDEVGVMLKNIQNIIDANHKLLTEKKELCHALTTDLRNQTLKTENLINTVYNQAPNTELKNTATEAIQSLRQQINFVDTYIEILVQEELINKQPIKVRKVNLQELFEEVKLKRTTQLEAKKVAINFKISIFRVRLKVSNTLLIQALGYLVDNAIKHAPEGTKIEMITEKNQGKLMIQISDNGVGFESRQADEIFSKFQLLSERNTDYVPSTGVYLASQIIERFGGTITAESDGPSRGVRFKIALKLYR